MTLTDLPVELLDIVLLQLDVPDFLSICRTCKALYQPHVRLNSSYWTSITRQHFRLPNRPAVEGDGKKWQILYKRLLTQTTVYTWGQGGRSSRGCLGRPTNTASNPVPMPIEHVKQLGVIADMQCGGWSTTFLTSNGVLHFAGAMDGDRLQTMEETEVQGWTNPLKFPNGFPSVNDFQKGASSDNPLLSVIAVRQFSSGRKHILGLSDSGRIWSWYSHAEPALHIKFALTDIHEYSSGSRNSNGLVKQVVAGWDKSSAYVTGTGIILWDVARRSRTSTIYEEDTMLVFEHAVVPLSTHSPQEKRNRMTHWQLEPEIGPVVNWVVLEHYVVFLTDIGRVFAARVDTSDEDGISIQNSAELIALRSTKPYPVSRDIQGSFRSFAVLVDGQVSVLSQDWLQANWAVNQASIEAPLPPRALIPALQNTGVQQLAFGDWHFHALHADGTITSYGKEPGRCGAFGLGGSREVTDLGLRGFGIRDRMDNALPPHAYIYGRRIWFEPKKYAWSSFLCRGGANPEEAVSRFSTVRGSDFHRSELSEWIEQESMHWEQYAQTDVAGTAEDGLGAYFALSVSAAGWHSGALVLVNEDLTEKLKARGPFWENQSFPRLQLSDGTDMPGTVPFSVWKNGRPEFDETQLQLWSSYP